VIFKDHFSGHAANYAKYRPHYPRELFGYVASLAPDRVCAWDCGTGNGQPAIELARLFDRVVATDASAKQIQSAAPNEKVEYRVAPAESKRVLKAQGVIVAWCYNPLEIATEIDAIVAKFYGETVGSYWPRERQMIEDRYQNIPFPFNEIPSPAFAMTAHWSLGQLFGYLRTWSATQAFIVAHRADPVDSINPVCQRRGENRRADCGSLGR
jgi:hypothetical protein